jgi:serine/threonine-protein kinase HipA
MMKKSGDWSMSPAYDICHAYRPGSDWVSQHALSLNGKRKGFKREDLLEVGKKMNIKNAVDIITEVADACLKWYDYADAANVDVKLRDSIQKTHIIL